MKKDSIFSQLTNSGLTIILFGRLPFQTKKYNDTARYIWCFDDFNLQFSTAVGKSNLLSSRHSTTIYLICETDCRQVQHRIWTPLFPLDEKSSGTNESRQKQDCLIFKNVPIRMECTPPCVGCEQHATYAFIFYGHILLCIFVIKF